MFLFQGYDNESLNVIHVTHKYFDTTEKKEEILQSLKDHFNDAPFKPFPGLFDKVEMFGKDKDVRVLRPGAADAFLPDLKEKLDAIRKDDFPEYKPHVSVSQNVDKVDGVLDRYVLVQGGKVIWQAPVTFAEEKRTLFHGSPRHGIKLFSLAAERATGDNEGPGLYLTGQREWAENFATGKDATIYEVEVDGKIADLTTDEGEAEIAKLLDVTMGPRDTGSRGLIRALSRKTGDQDIGYKELHEKMKSLGFIGFKYASRANFDNDDYVIFDPLHAKIVAQNPASVKEVKEDLAYHGTRGRFSSFNPKKLGSGSGVLFGNGIYFTTNNSTAHSYGKNVFEINSDDFKFLDARGDEKAQREIAKMAGIEIELKDDAFSNFVNAKYNPGSSKANTNAEFEDLVLKAGYDGLKISGREGSRIKPGETWFVVYNIKKLNELSKKSVKEAVMDEAVLSHEGMPVAVYHGTPVSNFRDLKPSASGFLGRGIYLTTSAKDAHEYTQPTDRNGQASGAGSIFKVHIDVNKLFDASDVKQVNEIAKILKVPTYREGARNKTYGKAGSGYNWLEMALWEKHAGADGESAEEAAHADIHRVLRDLGYDGIMAKRKNETHYLVMDAAQVIYPYDSSSKGKDSQEEAVAYHGSDTDFQDVELDKVRNGREWGNGLYLTGSAKDASEYAGDGDGAVVHMFDIDNLNLWDVGNVAQSKKVWEKLEAPRAVGSFEPAEGDNNFWGLSKVLRDAGWGPKQGLLSVGVQDAAVRAGFDGLRIPHALTGPDRADWFVVYNLPKIKRRFVKSEARGMEEAAKPKAKVWYHGRTAHSKTFDLNRIGNGVDQNGPGFYFTADLTDARSYAEPNGIVGTFKLTPRKLLDDKKKPSLAEVTELMRASPTLDDLLANWDEDPAKAFAEARKSMMAQGSQRDAFLQIWVDFFRYEPQAWAKKVVELGYDGLLALTPAGVEHLIIYSLDAIHEQGWVDYVKESLSPWRFGTHMVSLSESVERGLHTANQRRLFEACAELQEEKLTIDQALKVLELSRDDLGDEGKVKKAYRAAAMAAHPDRGGSEDVMKKVNAAYETLQDATSKGIGKSAGSRFDWDALYEKHRQLAVKAIALLKDKFDFNVFLEHFRKFDPTFEIKTRFFPEESEKRPDRAGFDAEFKSKDGTRRFTLRFTITLSDMNTTVSLGGDGSTYPYLAFTSAYVDGKAQKLKQERYTFGTNEKVLLDPEALFPSSRLKKFFSGEARKGSKFSKADMYNALVSELNGRVSDTNVYLPLGEGDLALRIYRSVFLRQPMWMSFGVVEGKYGSKRVKDYTKTFMESYATVKLIQKGIAAFQKAGGDMDQKIAALFSVLDKGAEDDAPKAESASPFQFGTHIVPLNEAQDLNEGFVDALKSIGKALVGWFKTFFSSPDAAKEGTKQVTQKLVQDDPAVRPLVVDGPYAVPENKKKKPGEPVKAEVTTTAKNVAAGQNKASIVTANLNGKKLFDLFAIDAGGKKYLKFVFEDGVDGRIAKRVKRAMVAQVGSAVVLESAQPGETPVMEIEEWNLALFGSFMVEGYVPGGLDEATKVQTLIFSKDHFDDGEAGDWARDHGFKAADMEETENSFRFRQKNPNGFRLLRTIRFTPGVQAVVGVKESADGSDTENDQGVKTGNQRAPSVPPNNRFSKGFTKTKHIETGGRRVYESADGKHRYTWDASKAPGEWEVYSARSGVHVQVLKPDGAFLADGVAGRKLVLKDGK